MSYLRGQGRGRGGPAVGDGNHPTTAKKQPKTTPSKSPGDLSADRRFEEISKQHGDSVARHLSLQTKTSPETLSSGHNEETSDELMKKITASYLQNSDATAEEVISTHSLLDAVLNEDSNVCLVCLDPLERAESIWNCPSCYCIIHLQCIQQWVNEGAYQQKLSTLSEQHFPNKKVPWHCPKCRNEYSHNEFPSVYKCFCGKVSDPADDPWQLPHSCGETCYRPLKLQCGHQCLLLCHPGPCPPCPKSVKVPCYCGQRAPISRRCGTKSWSCSQPCRKTLECGHHKCLELCHQGECKPCPETSTQSCMCGEEKQSRPCAQPMWSCQQRCGKQLPCGHHYCNKTCHRKGECGRCERSTQVRLCPCTKTSVRNLPCTEDVPCCGDTCGKPLSCGKHMCTEKCHLDNCSQCFQVSVKSCRCGAKQKELPCAKPFTCDTRCQSMKSCGRHMCKRRCCDATSCSACDQLCGKKLKCGNHKCTSICHTGPCYPCTITIEKACNCGKTIVSVPCIRQKTAQPPRCRRLCSKQAKCDHPAIQQHACHFSSCPPCNLTCDKKLSGCQHRCSSRCHDAINVKVQSEKKVLSGPWEKQAPVYNTVQKKPCPPCSYPRTVTCKGGHENSVLPCSQSHVYSCNRECGRSLSCTNHSCTLDCHVVTLSSKSQTMSNAAGVECETCDQPCSQSRPEGCTHHCLKPCHPGSCPPCKQAIKTRCFCTVTVIYVPCFEWTSQDFDKDEKLSCPGLCPKELACGHPCSLKCHPPGACQVTCTKKVVVRCPCKTIKQTVMCHSAKDLQVACKEKCQEKQTHGPDTDQGSQSEAVDEDVDPTVLMPGRRQRKRKERQVSESAAKSAIPWESVRKYGMVLGIVLSVLLAFYLAISADD